MDESYKHMQNIKPYVATKINYWSKLKNLGLNDEKLHMKLFSLPQQKWQHFKKTLMLEMCQTKQKIITWA
jgi:hypothetical protein